MSFKGILEEGLGREAVIRSPGEEPVTGKLAKIDEMYFVGKHYKPLNPEEISSIRQGKKFDIELEEGSDYFKREVLN